MATRRTVSSELKPPHSTKQKDLSAAKENESLLGKFFILDTNFSKRISICSDASTSSFQKRLLRAVLVFLEFTGHGIPWLCMPAFFAYTGSGKRRGFNFNLLFAMLFDLVIVGCIKVLVKRKRPLYNKDDMIATVKIDQFSFPSGHTTRGILVAIIFTTFLENRVYILLMNSWAVILAVSRIVLGRHHISDVVAGVIIGIFEAFFVLNNFWFDTKLVEYIMTKLTTFAIL